MKKFLVALSVFTSAIFSSGLKADEALTWDRGFTHEGETKLSASNQNGERCFRINTQAALNGGWRTILDVSSGEADVYLKQSSPPTTENFDFKSEQEGDDGFVISPADFSAGQTWYYLVVSSGNASWDLVTGDVYVEDLGPLNFTDDNSNGTYDLGEAVLPSGSDSLEIGPEGTRFFRSAIPPGTLAWQLTTTAGDLPIAVKTGSVPFHDTIARHDKRGSNLLLVPPYLGEENEAYFYSVEGEPGDEVQIVSQLQPIETLNYGEPVENAASGNFPFKVYQVAVSQSSVAWEISLDIIAGDPNIAVRRAEVGSDFDNNALFESSGSVQKSLVVTTPLLGEGLWYITVYGDEPFEINLTQKEAEFESVPFNGTQINDEPDKVGWKYYLVTELDAQLSSLGWELSLTGAPSNTEMVVRRNAPPSIWQTATSGTRPTISIRDHDNGDFDTDDDLLQIPQHEAGVWYVGVYSPVEPLGDFEINLSPFTPAVVNADGGREIVAEHGPKQWKFFEVDINNITGLLGWDVFLEEAAGSDLEMVVSRNLLPDTLRIEGWTGIPSDNEGWPTGATWTANSDWTGRRQDFERDSIAFQRMFSAYGQPLEDGVYYVGVFNDSTTFTYSYTLGSEVVLSDAVTPVNFANGVAEKINAPARSVEFYQVTIPENTESWEMYVNNGEGDVVTAIRKDYLPDFNAETTNTVFSRGGTRVNRMGTEFFYLYPEDGEDYVEAGVYYIAVVAVGDDAPNTLSYGDADSSYELNSKGEMSVTDLGTIGSAVSVNISLQEREAEAFTFVADTEMQAFELILEGVDRRKVYASIREGDKLVAFARNVGTEGWDGGWDEDDSGDDFILVANAGGKKYSFSIFSINEDLNFSFRIIPRNPVALPFTGGTHVITNQEPSTWRFFKVNVPAGFLGWDIGLDDISGGEPKLVVSKETIPDEIRTTLGSPSSRDNWESGRTWTSTGDWTQSGYVADFAIVENYRLLAASGQPLDPGNYIVGVFNDVEEDGGNTAYTLKSRSISFEAQNPDEVVTQLDFDGGSYSESNVPHHAARHFAIDVPEGASSWRVRLQALEGDANMAVRQNFLADFTVTELGDADLRGGVKVESLGNDWYHLLPTGSDPLSAGRYYITVYGFLFTSLDPELSFTIESKGEIPIKNMGEASTTALTEPLNLDQGEFQYFQFTVPQGTTNLQVYVDLELGYIPLSVANRNGYVAPATKFGRRGYDGGIGGTSGVLPGVALLYSLPEPGVYTVVTQATTPSTGELVVVASGIQTLDFNGGSSQVFSLPKNTWSYYIVDVPSSGYVGWDLELIDDSGGKGQIVVKKGSLPSTSFTSGWEGSPSANTLWPDEATWVQSSDWSDRTSDPITGSRTGDRFVAAFDRPLVGGRYFVGVTNFSSTPANFTLRSRGIGEVSSDALIKVRDISWDGDTASIENLGVRQAGFYRVNLPVGLPSWQARLRNGVGESMYAFRKGFIPDLVVRSSYYPSESQGLSASIAGDEWLNLLPEEGTSSIAPGDYYFAVVGEGQNPPNSQTVGEGDVSATLETYGEAAVTDLGVISASPISLPFNLSGGELQNFTFEVPPNSENLEVHLRDVGNAPGFAFARTTLRVDPGVATSFNYGHAGGVESEEQSRSLVNIISPTQGTYSLALNTESVAGVVLPASGTLEIRTVPSIPLDFADRGNGRNRHQASLLNEQVLSYRVDIPEASEFPQEVLGWRIRIEASTGAPKLRVYDLRSQRNLSPVFTDSVEIIAPPYFEMGKEWFFDITGVGLTEYTVISEPIFDDIIEWTMPVEFNQFFGDSGAKELGADDWDYYAIDVPEGNLGLLKTILEVNSGNPKLYLRTGSIPQDKHSTTGRTGSTFERSLTGAQSEYGNWVAFDAKDERTLEPGRWFVGIQAVDEVNASYRLQLSTGDVTEIEINEGFEKQLIAEGDWKYYKFKTPLDIPSDLSVLIEEQFGEVKLHVRAVIPPGLNATNVSGQSQSSGLNHSDDNLNQGPYFTNGIATDGPHLMTVGPTRMDEQYYLGVYAVSDAQFKIDLSASAEPATIEHIVFLGGEYTTTLEPDETKYLRFFAPFGADEISYSTVRSEGIRVRLEQGTIPGPTRAHYSGRARKDEGYTRSLTEAWPWVSGSWFVFSITNEDETSKDFFLQMAQPDGVIDTDKDGLSDDWEFTHFGNLAQGAMDDPNNDGVSNFYAYALDLSPVGDELGDVLLPRFTWVMNGARGGLEFELASPREELTYAVEASSTLSDWNELSRKEGGANWSTDPVQFIPATGFTQIGDAIDLIDANDGALPRMYRLKITLTDDD